MLTLVSIYHVFDKCGIEGTKRFEIHGDYDRSN